jgi:iron complex outermembrane recepter protein
MLQLYKSPLVTAILVLFLGVGLAAQVNVRGKVIDAETGEELIGATVILTAGGGGATTNYEGDFLLKVPALPVKVRCNYTGYTPLELDITSADEKITIKLESSSVVMDDVVIKGQRIDDKQKAAPLTVENLDAIAIKDAPAVSFYNALGNLKGVDLTTASLGFTIINMRGFNSTSPVRSLQIIDGVDNQAPGLNFSLGNFLGASDLDVAGVDLVAGASGPFFGPNAFNGVISIKSKDPFAVRGLSASLKGGERNLFEGAIRWADQFKNKDGHPVVAYKLNFFHLRAYDWVADNYDPVYQTGGGRYYAALDNPGRYDAVNIYGDEYQASYDLTQASPWDNEFGLQQYHRTGYEEKDLVDYNTRNYKASGAVHFRLNPKKEYESPELILASSFGSGTTVYQGDNRFSLRDILFFQNRVELRKKDKFFLRAYATNEDAGNSFDPYFTALRLQQNAKPNSNWKSDYGFYWNNIGRIKNRMDELGYPQILVSVDPVTGAIITSFDQTAADNWMLNFADSLQIWHTNAAAFANTARNSYGAFYEPGTPAFEQEFNRITSTKSGSAGGTRFFDKSALYHTHGEYRFEPKGLSYWVVGANARVYRPYSEGTIFYDSLTYSRDANGAITDSSYQRITNREIGMYTGIEKKFMDDKIITSATVRADKNQNFDWLFTPAASVVYTPNRNNFLRFSFSSAVRNPTLTDQYLFFNVGRAILVGNLNGFDSLITVPSFVEALSGSVAADLTKLEYFNVAPIRPEKVRTFEVGYRTTLFDQLYIDAGYYFNFYRDFIGYNLGVTVPIDYGTGTVNLPRLQAYRVAANAAAQVTTQGFNIGANYYFNTYYQLSGNYSWNRLNKLDEDDPIIPAFNTPEHKFNLTVSGRDMSMFGLEKTGFNVTYKWIEGFLFEGSPQFTGFIPTYDMVDAQWNCTVDRLNTTFKIGVTNLFGLQPLFRDQPAGANMLKAMFNNRNFQTYGGPRIGRLAYVSAVYTFDKR